MGLGYKISFFLFLVVVGCWLEMFFYRLLCLVLVLVLAAAYLSLTIAHTTSLYILQKPGNTKTPTLRAYTDGEWVYSNEAAVAPGYAFCRLDPRQDCRAGDVPSAFLHWRWQPRSIQLLPFDRTSFLECVRGMKVLFMGDSIARNNQQSLQCMLLDAPEEVEVKVSETDTWRVAYDSVYLAYSNASVNLRTTIDLHPSYIAQEAPSADSLVVSTGPHWFPKTFWGQSLARPVPLNMTFEWLDWPSQEVAALFDEQIRLRVQALLVHSKPNATIVWRVPDVGHHVGSENISAQNARFAECGGDAPDLEGVTHLTAWPAPFWYMRDAVLRHTAGTRIHVMDVIDLAVPRVDAHPSGHYSKNYNKSVKDCLHWCLPGLPDTLNTILYNFICLRAH